VVILTAPCSGVAKPSDAVCDSTGQPVLRAFPKAKQGSMKWVSLPKQPELNKLFLYGSIPEILLPLNAIPTEELSNSVKVKVRERRMTADRVVKW
jgi:hypothetical protein